MQNSIISFLKNKLFKARGQILCWQKWPDLYCVYETLDLLRESMWKAILPTDTDPQYPHSYLNDEISLGLPTDSSLTKPPINSRVVVPSLCWLMDNNRKDRTFLSLSTSGLTC